jgi:molecular chaperone DnaJ
VEGVGHSAGDGESEGLMADREWFEKDYYKVLGVSSTATDKDITRAYRKLAKANHPDANPGSEEKFKEISAANDVLGDPDKRKEYDEVRRLGPAASGLGGGSARAADFGDLGDLFGGLFGARRPRNQRGADVETSLHLGFVDAVKGATTAVSLPTDEACRTCGGSGAATTHGLVTCERCHGRGVLNDDQGPFSLSQVCPVCHGRGAIVTTPCADCHGTGHQLSSRRVSVRVPAGVEDNQRIRVKGKGAPGAHGGTPGDLYVTVHVASTPGFARRGRHVTTSASISTTQAMLGTTIDVATLDDPVTLKIPAGTQPGTTLRVRGRGVPAAGRHPVGDLLVTVVVDVPKKLNKEQRQLVEKLATSLHEEVRGE